MKRDPILGEKPTPTTMKKLLTILAILIAVSLSNTGCSLQAPKAPKEATQLTAEAQQGDAEAQNNLGDRLRVSSDSFITVDYRAAVHGYRVGIVWMPVDMRARHVFGPAILKFTDEASGEMFTVTTNSFGLSPDRLPFVFEYGKPVVYREPVVLEYGDVGRTEGATFGTAKEPFFFEDVDFDGQEDLLVAAIGEGQRGWSSFKAYKLTRRMPGSALYDITHEKPFVDLDERSVVDHKKNSIRIYSNGGAYCTWWEEYVRESGVRSLPENRRERSFVLSRVEGIYQEEGDVYESIWERRDGKLELIRKREIEQ